MYLTKSLRNNCYIGFILIYILQGCGITYSGMSGSSGGMSGSSGGMSGSSGGQSGSSGGQSGSSGGMSGSSGPVRGMSGRSMTGGPNSSSNASRETNAEKQARLEGELERSVGGLDEVLGQEQREIESVGRNTEGFGGNSSNRSGVGLGGQSTGGRQRGIEGSSSSSNAPVNAASVGELSQKEIDERTPDDIPDLVSEDIVAKQLREAALTENDPQLRERLWDEYRNYNRL